MFTGYSTHLPMPNVYNVQNSIQIMNNISQIPFVPELKLASLDICNTYTNILTKDLININTNKEFLCITRTVKHNYILLISTVRIQLHVSVLYVWTIFRLRFLTYRLVIHDVWGVWVGGGGTISRCFNSRYHDPELLEVNFL